MTSRIKAEARLDTLFRQRTNFSEIALFNANFAIIFVVQDFSSETQMHPIHIAAFISSHGFGHASRLSAIIESVTWKNPAVKISIFTETPRWVFEDSLSCPFAYQKARTDVGIVQLTPIEMDIPGTLRKLETFIAELPLNADMIAEKLRKEAVDFVVADISPLGIVSANRAGIPVLLLENFTWDWIYEPFSRKYPRFTEISAAMKRIFESASIHGQYLPACVPSESCDFELPPVSRKPRTSADAVRQRLGVRPDEKLAIVAMGGIPAEYRTLERIRSAYPDVVFAFTGIFPEMSRKNNVLQIPHHSDFFHPDLVQAADFVFGKVGYSTYSEIYNLQKPFAYLIRSDFRESSVLKEALTALPSAFEIDQLSFNNFVFDPWLEKMASCAKNPVATNGCDIAADNILYFIRSGKPRSVLSPCALDGLRRSSN